MHIVLASMGFPLFIVVTHYINLLFIGLLIRSGIQIAGAHPRLYWNDNCNPDSAWLNLVRKKVPKDRLYTSMDDEVAVPRILALPGKDNLGLGRHWHFFSIIFWILNGLIYWVLLFATGEWTTLIPTSWSIFPRAWQTFLTYATFHIPPTSEFTPLDPLQQLTYAAVVFLLAPFMLLTGAAMSPSIEARFPWYIKLFGGRQVARSLHFLSMIAFVLFIIVHVALVLIVHFQDNIRNIVFGTTQSNLGLAITIAMIALLVVVAVYVWASWQTLRKPRLMQHALGFLVDPVRKTLLHHEKSRQQYKQSAISPYFWVNGRPPVEDQYKQLATHDFADWKLEVGGLVTSPFHLSLEDLRKLPKQTQITKHNCIQGWSGVAEWGGVPLAEIIKLCGVKPEAKYVVLTSYQKGKESVKPELKEAHGHTYYEVIDMVLAQHPQTILAYEMNDQALPIDHGAPLRLRCETQLGYKMVKFLRSIEFVADYDSVGAGQGGFREDFQYYGRGAEI
ncbi:MAG TPA: molybdopterin-dependent oxidoreductase [Ktedonobacteraceae bacterium]|jgi:DMSO/TMAO reductase YedYZ molybdopterin-dependent catalytic subunit/thiosulfate reductase cytochrome b subunit|nr:molybdopterin-dependent oxidoreductase [Ktedonobacteraceae bacterium]